MEPRQRPASAASSSGRRPLKQVTEDILHFGSLRCFRHFEVEARSAQELVVRLRGARAAPGGADGGARAGGRSFLIGAFTRYNYPHVWRLRAADEDARADLDRPLALESTRAWKARNTRVWDFVRELAVAFGGLHEHENAFAIDFDALRGLRARAGGAGDADALPACVAAAGLLSFLRYAIETHSIRLTQQVLDDVRGLARVHVGGVGHVIAAHDAAVR